MSRKRSADNFEDYGEEVIVLPESPTSDEFEDNIAYNKYMKYANGQEVLNVTANTEYQLAPPPSNNKEPGCSGQNAVNAKASAQKSGIKLTPISEWKEEEGRLILRRFKDYSPNVGKDKKFKSKKDMWSCITEEINDTFNVIRSPAQCMAKFFHRYQSMKRPKKVEGVVTFQEELHSLDSIHDLVMEELVTAKIPEDQGKEKEQPLSVLYQILPKTMVELAKINAHGQERRHREYMESIKDFETKFLDNVSKLIDKY